MLLGETLVLYHPAAGTLLSPIKSTRSTLLESSKRTRSPPARSVPSTSREWARLHAAGFNLRAPSPIQNFRIAEGSRSLDASARTAQVGDNAEVRSKETRRTAEGAMDISQSIARQQRRLISLTDQVLLKRTQILHQQGNVKTCRKFLNASLKELNAAIDLWELQDQERRKARKTRKARKDKTKASIDGVANEGSSMAGMTVNVESSAAGITTPAADTPGIDNEPVILMKALSPNLKQPTATGINRKRQVAYDQYRVDTQALTTQESDLDLMTDELSNLEYELAKLHQSFAQHVKSRHFAEDLHSSLEILDLEAKRSSRRTSGAGTETPQLVSEYFEQKGDAGVYRERLEDLEFSYHEGIVERELMEERGDKQDVSNEEFRRNYDERRKDLNEEILIAEEKAIDLARRCAEAGLDIEKYRRTRSSEPAESIVDHAHSAFGPRVATEEALAIETSLAAEAKARTPIDERPSSRVGKWLRTVPEADQPLIAEGWVFPDEADAEKQKERLM